MKGEINQKSKSGAIKLSYVPDLEHIYKSTLHVAPSSPSRRRIFQSSCVYRRGKRRRKFFPYFIASRPPRRNIFLFTQRGDAREKNLAFSFSRTRNKCAIAGKHTYTGIRLVYSFSSSSSSSSSYSSSNICARCSPPANSWNS